MLFTSGEFLFVYLPLTLLLFFLIARYVGNAAAGAWLVLASFVFYAYWLPFYTFTQIAYLADVHAGKVRERNPLHYALFVSYFPHLIAGPVLHHAEMMPQFALPRIYRPRLENFAIGLAFLLIGLAKKVLLADSWAPLADDLFDSPVSAAVHAGEAWRGGLAYTLQIYFDFSGYSDMAIGLSLL